MLLQKRFANNFCDAKIPQNVNFRARKFIGVQRKDGYFQFSLKLSRDLLFGHKNAAISDAYDGELRWNTYLQKRSPIQNFEMVVLLPRISFLRKRFR